MKILSIDTSTMTGSVAVTEDETLLSEISYSAESSHAEKLIKVIDKALIKAKVNKSDIQGIAVAIGPGSFTGLRIGLATAKGLAVGLECPLAAISTLEALALNVLHSKEDIAHLSVVPCIDARRDEAYTAVYKIGSSSSRSIIHAECSIDPKIFAQELAENNFKYLFLGDGVLKYRTVFENELGVKFVLAKGSLVHEPHALSVGLIASARFKKKNYSDIAGSIPNYIRKSAAEIKREAL